MCTISISSRKAINISVSVDREFLEGDGLNEKGGGQVSAPSCSCDFHGKTKVALCSSQPAASLAPRSSSSLYVCMPAPMRYTTQPDTAQSKTEACFLPV